MFQFLRYPNYNVYPMEHMSVDYDDARNFEHVVEVDI
jgi:hypothetical protein